MYVSASDLEPNTEIEDTDFLTHKLISPEGEILENYKRVQPDNPTFNGYRMNGRLHVLPGDTFARCRPAQQLQSRPEMYGMLLEPHPEALNYFYYLDGLDTYLAEEKRAEMLRTKEYKAGPVRKVVAPSKVDQV